MPSETDLSSLLSLSLSELDEKPPKKRRRKKKNKKHKRARALKKKQRKEQLKKEMEKRSNEDNGESSLPTGTKFKENDTYEKSDIFGPVLPPHLLNNDKIVKKEPLVIGPIVSKQLLVKLEKPEEEEICSVKEMHNFIKTECEDNELKDFYGPLPLTSKLEMTPAQIELEKRALELKMAAIDGVHPSSTDTNVREEWMLELPDVGLKTGLAALNNLKRSFHQGKEKPDFSDRSSWTKAPNSPEKKQKTVSSKECLEWQAQSLRDKHRDAEQEAIAKEHKRKHKREESLVEIHQKKLRKEERKKMKELKESGSKPERRPFTRDIDLKLNKIDRNQTKQIVDKAKILNTKFSSGHSKYL